jgi:predicted permease
MLSDVLIRLRSLFRRKQVENELDDELRFHFDQHVAKLGVQGTPRDEALRQARLTFGPPDSIKEEHRDARGTQLVETLAQDVRYALRVLAKSPGFTAVAILTLALGIGANTAIFSVVNAVVLAPLPYHNAGRLALVLESNQRFPKDAISYPNFLDWQRSAKSFSRISAIMIAQSLDLTSPGNPMHVDANRISAGFFETLGASLAVGREFTRDEDVRGGPPVVIISASLAENRFGSTSQAVGRTLVLDGVAHTVVGVLPPSFRTYLGPSDAFVPLAQGPSIILDARGAHDSILAITRLNPGVTLAQAQSEMTAIQSRLDSQYAADDAGLGAVVLPLKTELTSDIRPTLFLLLCAVGLVLLIACANVANLILARSTARRREFAVRSALGAAPSRIARQIITESVVLSLFGGLLGVVAAKVGAPLAIAALPPDTPRAVDAALNLPVLLFAFVLALVVGTISGLAPAIRSSRSRVNESLADARLGSASANQGVQNLFVVAQLALSIVLLFAAGLLLQTLRHLWQAKPGFDTTNVITFRIGLGPSSTKDGATLRAAFLESLDRIRAVPGIEAADFTLLVPLTNDDNDAPFWFGDDKPAIPQNAPRTLIFDVGPDFARTFQIPVLRGRFFTEADNLNSPRVAVIDRVLAQTYFRDQDPLGKTMTFGWPASPWGPCTIIGVVEHVNHWGIAETSTGTRAESYYPMLQAPPRLWPLGYPASTIVVRTPLTAASIMPAIETALGSGASAQTVYSVKTMHQIAADSMSAQRSPMILLSAFAGLALLLAAIGVYGVMSHSVALRLREFGIRMALGAGERDVLRLVLLRALRVAFIGLAIGLAGALVLARTVSSFSSLLYGVRAGDPLTLAAVSVLLCLTVVVASLAPAMRAVRIDPINVLRQD